jgi:hypothetical protein
MLGTDYLPPLIVDYGDLCEMTASVHPLLGATTAQAPPFSAAAHGPAGGTAGTNAAGQGAILPQQAAGGASPGGSGDTAGTDAGGGGTSGGGGGSGGGGSLPFTGLVAGAVAATGTALAGAGAALRRALRRR